MAVKLTTIDTDYIIKEYRAGQSSKNIANQIGVGTNTVIRRLKEANEPMRPSAFMPRINLPESEVVCLFDSGVGVNGISKHFGISGTSAVIRVLENNGRHPRNRSEQQFARMSKTSPEERKKLAYAANKAARGRTPSEQTLSKMAETYELRGNRRVSKAESDLAAMLIERGVCITPQKAIGRYNCDLASHPVAVEVFGGHWHWHGDHLARCEKRTRYMLDAGWHVLMIAVNDGSPLTAAVADYVVAYIDTARRNPSAAREYRVIWRAGEFSTAGGLDDDNFSIEPPFVCARDRTTGQYKTVAR